MTLSNNKFIKRLKKDKIVLAGLIILATMYICIAFAGFFAPYSKFFSDRSLSYSPPSKIYIINQEGKLSMPYTYNYKRHFNPETFRMDYTPDKSQKYFLKFFAKGDEYKLFGFIPCDIHLVTVDEPGKGCSFWARISTEETSFQGCSTAGKSPSLSAFWHFLSLSRLGCYMAAFRATLAAKLICS